MFESCRPDFAISTKATLSGSLAAVLLLFIWAVGSSHRLDSASSFASGVPTRGVMIFDGREYMLETAEMVMTVPDPYGVEKYNPGRGKSIGFAITLEAEVQEVGDEWLSPHVDFDGLRCNQLFHWRDLGNVSEEWSEPTREPEGRYGMTYLHDHQLITKGKVKVTHYAGSIFRVIATGTNEEGQVLFVDAPVKFNGVYVNGSKRDDAAALERRLSEQLSVADLKAGPVERYGKYDSGVEMCSVLYSPSSVE